MLKSKLMFQSPHKRIEMSMWKQRAHLVIHLQEFDTKPSDPGWKSFMMFQSWNPTIARVPCARATAKAVEAAWNEHMPAAVALVAKRVEVLNALGDADADEA
jgi:hypothetical protein